MKSKFAAIPAVILLSASLLAAQDAHPMWHLIKGIVLDGQGSPLANTTVCLKDSAGHRLRLRQTDGHGHFSFGLVNLRGAWEIYAEERGIASQRIALAGSFPKRDIVVRLKIASP